MYLPTNSITNVTSVNHCAIHYCNNCITTNLAVETHCVIQYYINV